MRETTSARPRRAAPTSAVIGRLKRASEPTSRRAACGPGRLPLASASPAVYYAEAPHRGYVVVEVTPDELRADHRHVSTTAEPTAELSTGASWRVGASDPVPQPA